VATLAADDENGFYMEVYQKDDPSVRGRYRFEGMPAGESWRFHHWVYRDTAYIDNYSEQPVTSFAYDAGGQRVKATRPDGTTIYTPFPNYEETVAGANTTTRATYSLAGQATAVRVSGDPNPANNGLFYLHSDHLGSVSAMSDENGNLVGSVTRYTPFGEYRSGGPNPITDRAYTGQKENMADLGLYYYNARFYAPGLGRFVSADTLVPDPASPQSLNRYAYTLNSPVNFTDPTGHFTEDAIRGYLWEYCAGDESCFTETFNQWRGDEKWWDMLRAAQTGDVLIGGTFFGGDHGMFYTFQGQGQDVLNGIYWSDPYGNQLTGDGYYGNRDGYILNDFFNKIEVTWDGFIRWGGSMPSFYVRLDSPMPQETTSDGVRAWLSRGWNAVGFFGGLAVPGGKAEKTVGVLGVFAIPSIDSWWLSVNGMQHGDVQVYIGDHRLIFNGTNNSYRLRSASWAWERKSRWALRVRYWSE